jgi:hypothetical protein
MVPVKPNVPMRPAALKGTLFKFSGFYFRPGTRSGKRDFECVTTFFSNMIKNVE